LKDRTLQQNLASMPFRVEAFASGTLTLQSRYSSEFELAVNDHFFQLELLLHAKDAEFRVDFDFVVFEADGFGFLEHQDDVEILAALCGADLREGDFAFSHSEYGFLHFGGVR